MIRKKIQSIRNMLTATVMFWSATMIANILNWLYNVQMGRTLSKEEFAILTVFLSFQYLISVPAFAITSTIARFVAFYTEKQEEEKHFYFFRQYWWLACGAGIGLFALFLLGRNVFESFFNIKAPFLPLLFSGMILPLFLLAFEKGNLLGKLAFGWLSILVIVEPLVKLSMISFGEELPFAPLTIAVVALPISIFATWFASLLITRSYHPMSIKKTIGRQKDLSDTYSFLGNALFAGLGGVLLYNTDVLLANHYLSSSDAGIYSTLSLLGKMLYFGAGSLIPLLIPFTAKAEAQNISTQKVFTMLMITVGVVGLGILATFSLFPQFTVSMLLTERGLVTLPYLFPYMLAMLFFVLASCYSSYNLAKKQYLPARLMLIAAIIEASLITRFHSSIEQITFVVLATLFGLFFSMLFSKQIAFYMHVIKENLTALTDLITPFSVIANVTAKKRILILNWRDTKHIYAGGAELYLHEIAKQLSKSTYTITFFTSNDAHSKREETIDGITVIRRGGFVTVYLWAALYLLTKFRNKFDLIIDSENGIPFFTPLFSNTKKILLIHHVHQDVFLKHLVPPFSWIANFLETHIMPVVYKKTPIIAVSPSTAQSLTEQLDLVAQGIIPTGVNTTFFVPGKKSMTPLISYVGRLKEYKGVQDLIRAFILVHKKFPNAKLVIAGDGDYKSFLMQLVTQEKLTKYVTFSGKVTEAEKLLLLQQSWLMVHPSYMEGWGITCLEANACGTPVIAANSLGLRDAVLVGKSGYLYPYGDTTQLALEILSLLSDTVTRNKLAKSSRVYSLMFSWNIQAKKFEKLFKQTDIFTSTKTQKNKSLKLPDVSFPMRGAYEKI